MNVITNVVAIESFNSLMSAKHFGTLNAGYAREGQLAFEGDIMIGSSGTFLEKVPLNEGQYLAENP